ncbi:unnamed protein product [Lymnaea stagnalis]|uniref:Uncharacterized protein n=1 Tax=Lymnaea stagnalis TaxID=6523 RepID=A0AAV2I257_LYMST
MFMTEIFLKNCNVFICIQSLVKMNFEKQLPLQLDAVSEQILQQTPLHYACYIGDGHLLDTLIGKVLLYNNNGDASSACVGALVSEEDALNGWTPAHWAAFYGQLSCLMKLHVKPYLGFDTPTHRSNTSPLHLAAQSGAVLCLKWLLQCGASRNKQDFMGETPLHKAAKAGNTDCVAMLVSHGASLDMKNHRGLIPAELAEQYNHFALAQYLKGALEYAERGSQGKTHCDPLPITDWNNRNTNPNSSVQPSPYSYTTQPKFSEGHNPTHSHNIFMNGEGIYTNFTKDSVEMEESESEMAETSPDFGSSDNIALDKMFGGMKRSFDYDSDDGSSHINKRRCYVPASQKCHKERYGDAYNNNIISSYNAVLAMKVEPLTEKNNTVTSAYKPGSPVAPQSSLMEHQASVDAQQGYDSAFMTTVTSAFH